LGSAKIATPAKTWEQLKNDVKRITLRNGFSIQRSGVALGTSANINRATDIISLLMLQNHAVPYSDDYSRVTIDQSIVQNGSASFPASDALNYYSSFALPGSDVYNWNSQSDYSTDAFANGQVAYVYGYSYLRDTIKQKAPNLNYDVTSVPQPNTSQNLINYANYWGFGVWKQTKNVNASWALVAFMTQKDSLKAYYKHHSLPSSRKDIISEQINDPDIGVFAAANLTAKSMYKRNAPKFENIFAQMIDAVTLRGQSTDSALRDAAEQINLINQRSSQQ
jgi:ABC-type glycerol-3-phosphate transport system substrate-binding protein